MNSGVKKAALITGSGKRLGAEIALELAKSGYDIALHYNRSEEEAFNTQKKIKKFGRDCAVFKGDLKDMNFVNELIRVAFFSFPYLNTLINSASVFIRSKIKDTTSEMFDELFRVNLKAPFFLIKEFTRFCNKGNIINILDTKTVLHESQYAAYILSRRSLLEFTKLAAAEFSPGIRCNGICPGLIMPAFGESEEYVKKLESRIALGRTGTAQNITRTVRFLLDNDFITGESIFVDGGENFNTKSKKKKI